MGVLQSAAVFQIGGDARRRKGMATGVIGKGGSLGPAAVRLKNEYGSQRAGMGG